MSNRQARREQSRQARGNRPTRPVRPAGGRAPRRQGGGGTDLFSLPYLLGVGALIVALVVVLVFVASGGGGADTDLVKKIEEGHAAFPADMVKGATVGKDDAPVKLDQYEDFQCPFCLRYTANQEPAIIEEYVKTGKVQLTHKHLPIVGSGQESARAAMASQCAADQGKFWDYKSKLFTVQAEAGQGTKERVDVGRFSDGNLKKYAGELGLDQATFDNCLDTSKHLKTLEEQQRTARAVGLSGTPAFTINGQALSASGAPSSIEDWRKVLDTAYERLTASPTPAGSPSPGASASPAGTTSPAPATPTTPVATGTPQASPTRQ